MHAVMVLLQPCTRICIARLHIHRHNHCAHNNTTNNKTKCEGCPRLWLGNIFKPRRHYHEKQVRAEKNLPRLSFSHVVHFLHERPCACTCMIDGTAPTRASDRHRMLPCTHSHLKHIVAHVDDPNGVTGLHSVEMGVGWGRDCAVSKKHLRGDWASVSGQGCIQERTCNIYMCLFNGCT